MKKALVFACVFLSLLWCNAQDLQNANWVYSDVANGLTLSTTGISGTFPFPSVPPAPPTTNNPLYLEGCASVSDQNGNLLMFTDGQRLWRNNPGATATLITSALLGNYSSTQNVIFVPRPGNPGRYYVFTIDGNTGLRKGIHYTEVDVNTNQYFGLNTELKTGIMFDSEFNQYPSETINEDFVNESQCISSTKHSNGRDYWVVTHAQNSSNGFLLAFRVTCDGVRNASNVANQATTAKIFPIPNPGSNIAHAIKISPNSQRMAMTTAEGIYIGTFNNTSGAININTTLDYANSGFVYGYALEFSPDSNILFFSNGSDITVRNLTTSATTSLTGYTDEPGMQLARNNKIYINNGATIDVINTPNNFSSLGYTLNVGTGGGLGLPQWVHWQPTPSTTLQAADDLMNVTSCATYTRSVLLANPTTPDKNNGTAITSLTGYTLTVVGALTPVPAQGSIVLNPSTGIVTVAPTTTNGTYTIKYRLCANTGCTCSNDATVTIVVNSSQTPTTPTFTLPTSICSGSTALTLPTTSNNGVTGTWSPSTVSNTTSGTYAFTPTAGLCANSVNVTITVIPTVTPIFSFATSFCIGNKPPSLPTTSSNGITGTWSPSTASDTATGNYTFTPNGGQCATVVVVTVTANPIVTPTFSFATSYCAGGRTPIFLPTTSDNGITGTWNPSTIGSSSATYTFTPAAGQCATGTSVLITIIPRVTPTFSVANTLCYGNTPPTLPTTSNNGVTGTWNPSTVSNTTTATYTFTPSSGMCISNVNLTITIIKTVPTFSFATTLTCGGTVPTLPTTSNNGITGNWSPSVVSDQNTGNYTFTPNAGQCAPVVTVTVTVTPATIPNIHCFGFDPTNNPNNTQENFGFVDFSPNTVSNPCITFTWYFRFYDHSLLTLYGENPIFNVACETNPVMAFGVMVSNGTTTTKLYAPPLFNSSYAIPGFSSQNPSMTCFIHAECMNFIDGDYKIENNDISIYPNPTSSEVNFSGNRLEEFSIQLFDVTGREIMARKGLSEKIFLDNCPTGVYLYDITHNSISVKKGKIVKK